MIVLPDHWTSSHGRWCQFLHHLGILDQTHWSCAAHFRDIVEEIRTSQ